MRTVKVALSIVLAISSISIASAQGAKPADPSSWGKGASSSAHANTGNGEVVRQEIQNLGGRGFSGARHESPGEDASHPTPPSGVDVPVGN